MTITWETVGFVVRVLLTIGTAIFMLSVADSLEKIAKELKRIADRGTEDGA